jgi:ankyrin repeat protein
MRPWSMSAILVSLVISACNQAMTPEAARKELGRMNLQYNEAAFIDAARNGDSVALDLFLKAGMDVNARDSAGRLAYMFLSKSIGGRVEFKEAVNQSVSVDTSKGTTALMAAAAIGRTEIVKSLLKQKADVDIEDRVDMNALSYAKWAEQPDIVAMLTQAGATDPKEPEPKKR